MLPCSPRRCSPCRYCAWLWRTCGYSGCVCGTPRPSRCPALPSHSCTWQREHRGLTLTQKHCLRSEECQLYPVVCSHTAQQPAVYSRVIGSAEEAKKYKWPHQTEAEGTGGRALSKSTPAPAGRPRAHCVGHELSHYSYNCH